MREFWSMLLVLCLILGACTVLYIRADRPNTRKQESSSTMGTTATTLPTSTTNTTGTTGTTGTTAPPTTGTTAPPTTGTTAPPTTGTTAPPTTETTAPNPPVVLPLEAKYAFAYDDATGQMLYTHGDLYQACSPASITKIFTAYVALQILSPESQVQVGSEIYMINPYSSIAQLSTGDILTVEQLIAGMMLPSGNDAAYTVAVAAGRTLAQDFNLPATQALERFMDRVNQQVAELGLVNTHFVTPDGIDAQGHYSCAYDILTMTLEVYRNPIIRRYAAMAEYSFTSPSGKQFSWKNSNMLLHSDSAYYIPQAVGMKTGSTNLAGNCLVSLFEVDGRLICICVLGCETTQQRYDDTLLLYQYTCP